MGHPLRGMSTSRTHILVGLLLLLLGSTVAMRRKFFSNEFLTNKWIPHYFNKTIASTEAECRDSCDEQSVCNAYAFYKLVHWCLLYNLTVGNKPVKYDGFKLFIKEKTEEEGFYKYGTMYIRLMVIQRKNAYEARKTCQMDGGALPSVRNEELNNLLLKVMIKHSVWGALIGVSDHKTEGEWMYEEGDPATYTNWHWKGMWNRYDLNCAIITIDGTWKHTNCWAQNYFFCQIPMF